MRAITWNQLALVLLPWLAGMPFLNAQGADPYLDWVRSQASSLRRPAKFEPEALRQKLTRALGLDAPLAQDLQPQVLGKIEGDGYTIEKVTFQTLPGVRMPGLLYLPKTPGKKAAVLHVHGHWAGAKQDPVLQARCVATVRAGMVALAVDAFGAGERGVGRALGEYHGGMTGAGLLPVGLPLCGVQILENMQALTYLQSRPEVDGERLGVTGASGGGNQTMYIAAWDKRVRAAVPVCSVGNYQAYLGAACCMCEVVPGALGFTEEGGILSLTAPRALMVINASRDARQFSPEEARKSLDEARKVYAQSGVEKSLVHKVFESGHDYSRPMRESMVGFMRLHLQGKGDGSPVPEADFTPRPREELRCYPAEANPPGWVTVPQLAFRLGTAALEKNKIPEEGLAGWKKEKLSALNKVLSLSSKSEAAESGTLSEDGSIFHWEPRKGLRLTAAIHSSGGAGEVTVLLHPEGGAAARKHPLYKALADAGAWVVTPDLRGQARPADAIGTAPDHNTAEWALWLGKPMLGQWTEDVRTLVDQLVASGATGRIGRIRVVGVGSMGLVALTAAADAGRIRSVATYGMPVSLLSQRPINGQRLGILVPRLLVDVGDIPHLAALAGPEKVIIAGGVDGQNADLPPSTLEKAFQGVKLREILPTATGSEKKLVSLLLQNP